MSRTLVLLLVLGSTMMTAPASDWPMWRYDVGRTAECPQDLPEDLTLLWHRELPKPEPAFADVRLQFDGGYEPVVMGKRLFLGSNCEDKVTAYDTGSGARIWDFHTNGPVRLAPVAWRDRVLFGSDDGWFYCVEAATGREVWKVRAVPSERKLLGNGRLISVWPIRGGPVLQDERVYFAAGVWPSEGVFIFCLDANSGERIWVNDSTGHLYGQQPHNAVAIGGIAPQGYLLIDGDDLVVPSSNAYPGRFDLETGELKDFKLPLGGRLPGGWYASLAGRSAQGEAEGKPKRKSLLADLGVNVMRHEGGLRTEGQAGVRTTIRSGGREFRFAQGFSGVPGTVHTMIAADGKLFVTTVAGGLYAFGAGISGEPGHHRPVPAARPETTELAGSILDVAPRHGYGVFLGAPGTGVLHDLAARSALRLVVIDADAVRVAGLRKELDRLGLLGSRVAVHHGEPGAFEMPPYFASFIVVSAATTAGDGARDRIFESVRPYGGMLIELLAGERRITTRDGALSGSANYLGDFEPNHDALVKAPLGVLWFDDTLGHFKRSPQPKFVDGVMVSTTKTWLDRSTPTRETDYRLVAPTFSDVYTGRVLAEEEARDLRKAPMARVDLETVQPKQYRPDTQKDDWKPEAPVAGHRQNPLTGETEARTFPKSYGCDGGFDYGNLYTMRSGTASFYDKRVESGTINISGPRSGCTNSVIPANGVLNVPYFYKGCTCSYPLPTGLAMYSLPESYEQWTSWGAVPREKLDGKIQRIGINFGAPADRMTESGTLWLDYPGAGGPSPDVEVVTVPAVPRSYYHHSVWMMGGKGWPWVAASGVTGIESVGIRGLKPGSYRVELTFASPDGEERACDIRLQGRLVAEGVRIGGRMVGVVRTFPAVDSKGEITLSLAARVGTTQLSGIEIRSAELP